MNCSDNPLINFSFMADFMKPFRLIASPENTADSLIQIIEHETENIVLNHEPDASLVRRAFAKCGLFLPNSAIKDLAKAIEMNPEYIPAYYSRALIYTSIGKLDLAFADNQKCHELIAKPMLEMMKSAGENASDFYKQAEKTAATCYKIMQKMMESFVPPWTKASEESPPDSTEK
jgi:tetratricopeptide (TPR) repeat protein